MKAEIFAGGGKLKHLLDAAASLEALADLRYSDLPNALRLRLLARHLREEAKLYE
jgi:hypothetical protein